MSSLCALVIDKLTVNDVKGIFVR